MPCHHLYSSGKRYPDMTNLSASILPVLGMTCQCNVKLNSLPRRLLPCTRKDKFYFWNIARVAPEMCHGYGCRSTGWVVKKSLHENGTWSTKRYLFAVWNQNFACSLAGIMASQSDTYQKTLRKSYTVDRDLCSRPWHLKKLKENDSRGLSSAWMCKRENERQADSASCLPPKFVRN